MNYYEHHLGDYAQATAHLSLLEDAVYSRLIRKYYASEKPIPADVAAVQRLVGARSKEERAAVETVLNEFFELRDDGWHQARCDAEIARYQDKQDKAKRSANARWNKRNEHTEGNAIAMRTHMRTHSEGNALQTPDTRKEKEKKEKSTPDKPADVLDSVWADFIAIRRAKRSPLTPTALAGIEREAKAAGLSLGDALRVACERGWQSFKAAWLDPKEQETARATARGSGWWTSIGYGSEAMARADGHRPAAEMAA